jgi:hypothetical protein
VHNLFETGKLAGQYLTEYQDYKNLFNKIATSCHHSCLILISWENSGDIENLTEQNKYPKTLQLQGLGENATEILREKNLKDEENWQQLIIIYQGHPDWLNIIASNIKLFDGKVSLYVTDENELFLGDITAKLAAHLQRLSALEQQVIKWLATEKEPIDREHPLLE